MIDVIARPGRYKPNATSLQNDFIVEGEQRYWVHVATDRFTGEVIDQQLEAVYEWRLAPLVIRHDESVLWRISYSLSAGAGARSRELGAGSWERPEAVIRLATPKSIREQAANPSFGEFVIRASQKVAEQTKFLRRGKENSWLPWFPSV
jgi:hypothetical protein